MGKHSITQLKVPVVSGGWETFTLNRPQKAPFFHPWLLAAVKQWSQRQCPRHTWHMQLQCAVTKGVHRPMQSMHMHMPGTQDL